MLSCGFFSCLGRFSIWALVENWMPTKFFTLDWDFNQLFSRYLTVGLFFSLGIFFSDRAFFLFWLFSVWAWVYNQGTTKPLSLVWDFIQLCNKCFMGLFYVFFFNLGLFYLGLFSVWALVKNQSPMKLLPMLWDLYQALQKIISWRHCFCLGLFFY